MKKTYEDSMIVKEWITFALIKLMNEYKFEAITITQIALTAGVPRITFYRNYKTKMDILLQYNLYLSERFSKIIRDAIENGNCMYWEILFEFIRNNQEYFHAIISAEKGYLILMTMNNNILNIAPQMDPYYLHFFTGALYNVIVYWISNNFQPPSGEMQKKFKKLITDKNYESVICCYIDFFQKLL